MQVLNAWRKKFAEVKANLKMQLGSASNKRKFVPKAEKQKFMSFASEAQVMSNQPAIECRVEDNEHKIWNCNQFKKKE